MSLITTYDLGKSYDPSDIFSGISLSIPKHSRIGVVGANGIGKTTLLRLLAGLEEPTSGKIQRAHGLQIGYLPQEAVFDTERTLWEECLDSFKELLELQREMAHLEQAMSDPLKAESIMDTYGHKQQKFDRLGGYSYENRIRQTLSGLGFTPGDVERPLHQLSGGQRTRAVLARLLLSDPDLLLLDEPTNHLDITAIEWLESYLGDWKGAVVCVSHDRYFLDQVVHTIWEMTPALIVYPGNYTAYTQQREERYKRLLDEYEAQQEFIEKEEEYIRRNIAGQNTRQAQGRRKRLERLLVEARLTPPGKTRRMSVKFQPINRSGDLVIRTKDLSIGFADEGHPLFKVHDLVLKRRECAAIIGPNGAGKTTFLKTLLGQIPPLQGEVILGSNLKIGYFAQAHEGLHPDWTLMEEIQAVVPKMLPSEIRNYLARFLFTEDDVFKKVSVLSGGERGRLALACLALSSANLLLLDEPTNHLDLPSQEVLQNVMAEYAGTFLLVSHDRYLVDALATQIWEVIPSDGRLRLFQGSYSEYKVLLQEEAARKAAAQTVAQKRKSEQAAPRRPRYGLTPKERRLHQHKQDLEMEITILELHLEQLGKQLENSPTNLEKVGKLGQEYQNTQLKLDQLLEEWSTL